jgi:hypothetical protein
VRRHHENIQGDKMNRNKTLALFLLFACLAIAPACNVSFSTANIKDATLAKDVDANKEAVNPTSTFDSDVKVIHCVVHVANAPEDTKLKAKWMIVKAEGQQPNQQILETNVDATNNNTVFDFSMKPNSELPPGDYKVDVYLNPKGGADEQPTKSLPFTVKASMSAPSAAPASEN